MKFVAFSNFAAFSMLCNKLWQNSQGFDIHSNIRGVLIFAFLDVGGKICGVKTRNN